MRVTEKDGVSIWTGFNLFRIWCSDRLLWRG